MDLYTARFFIAGNVIILGPVKVTLQDNTPPFFLF